MQSGGWTGLHEAALLGNEEIIMLLLENGANKTIKKNDGKTAYDIALEKDIITFTLFATGSERVMNKWSVGIFLFNDVEVLDFAGPFEVFSVTEADEENHLLFIQLVKMEK